MIRDITGMEKVFYPPETYFSLQHKFLKEIKEMIADEELYIDGDAEAGFLLMYEMFEKMATVTAAFTYRPREGETA